MELINIKAWDNEIALISEIQSKVVFELQDKKFACFSPVKLEHDIFVKVSPNNIDELGLIADSISGAYGKKEYGSNGFGKIANYGLSLNQSIYNPALSSKIDIETSKVALSNSEMELKKQELSQIVLPIYLEILKSQNI